MTRKSTATVPFDRRAGEPFRFEDYEGLVLSTGSRAGNLREFTEILRTASTEVIRHHLHRAPLRHRFGVWDFPNDFARWALDGLGDHALAEKLAAMDPYAHRDPGEAQGYIVELLEEHLDELPALSFVRPGMEFHFCSSRFVAMPGDGEVWTLGEMQEALGTLSLGSLFYHFHEARLREPEPDTDDFSLWIAGQFGDHPLVRDLRGMDFYFFSLEDLRRQLVHLFEKHRPGNAA